MSQKKQPPGLCIKITRNHMIYNILMNDLWKFEVPNINLIHWDVFSEYLFYFLSLKFHTIGSWKN